MRPRSKLAAGLVGGAAVLVAGIAAAFIATSSPQAAGTTRVVPAGGSWNSCYQASAPGDTCSVSPGSYGGQSLSFRSDLVGKCDRSNQSSLIHFVPSGAVSVNGELEVSGSCVGIVGSGFNVHGEASAFGNYPSQIPDNILFQGFHAVHYGVLTADHVTFDSMDIGPATVVSSGGGCSASEGPGDENKINSRWGASVANQGHVPSDVLISNSLIHNQQGRNPDRGDCHYGGTFIVNGDKVVYRGDTFYGNVVYNVQIQNFAGPAVTSLLFDGNSFGCPADWLEVGGCDGQRSIQFDYDPGTQVTLTNNASANGPGGLYGCYVGTCGGLSGLKVSGTQDYPASLTPPPFNGGGGTTTTTTTQPTTTTSTTSTTTTTQPTTTTSTTTSSTTTTTPPPDSLPLHIVSQTNSTVTIGWTPAGNRGYIFYRNGTRVSNTFNPAVSSVRFSKGGTFKVEALNLGPFGTIASP